ncbi:MAG TPA: signal peptidase I [Kiritimatiellia bacterium]|nr:signal peptidase I [Kiritimatiellia bacterium]
MMQWLERRRRRKMVRHILHEARHLRHMREDIAPEDDLAAMQAAEDALRAARKGGVPADIDAAAERLAAVMDQFAPHRSHPRVRENLEILVVAVVVAMAFRTYFIQPFKIPTGSMQPTLYGITVQPQLGRQWYDYFPLNLVPLALFGERYREVRAEVDGLVDSRYEESEELIRFYVGGVPHEMPRNMKLVVQPGYTRVKKGQLLASGRVRLGDHIFVNKVRYNFNRPERGDIFVFSTDGIDYPRIRTDAFYIKRMAGMPGERIELVPPFLLANGEPIREPMPFARLQDRSLGYNGYQLPYTGDAIRTALGRPGQELHLSETKYLPLGDNTMSSLDGRYFGGVERKNIVGPAFMVYWPLGNRWGWVR